MKMPVTNREVELKDTSSIVSKTDLRGIITYINRDFLEISGFTEQELIGKNHNLVRHPDMPPAAFQDLWDTVKAGKPWNGIVKNRCKNGDHYWVEANVAPVREGPYVIGYMSVRSKPTRKQISEAEHLYRQIRDGKVPKTSFMTRLVLALRNTSLYYKVLTAMALPVCAVVGFAMLGNPKVANGWVIAGIGAVAALIASALLTRVVVSSIQRTTDNLNAIAGGDLQLKIDTTVDDEFGKMVQALKSMQIKLGFDVNDARKIAEESMRLQVGLDNSATGVTFSDGQNLVQYINEAATILWQGMFSEVQKYHADFSVKGIMGKSIGQYFEKEADRAAFS